jgi:hypothetical protein
MLPCFLLHAACCMLRCMSLLSAACCLDSGACCLLRGAWHLLFAAYCPLHAACCLEVVCCTRVVRYIFPVADCMSSVTFSPMHDACCRLSVAHFPVVVCGIADRWIVSACPFFVACRTFSVACFLLPAPVPECCMVCAVCRLTRVAFRRVARCNTHALCRMLSLVRCLSRLARRLLHAVCCPLQSDSEPSCSQRIAAALAV